MASADTSVGAEERHGPGRARDAMSAAANCLVGLVSPLLRVALAATNTPIPRNLRPRDAARGHAPGHDLDRILILGAGLALGWGVSMHELALPGALARAVSAKTRRGSDVDLVANAEMDTSSAALVVNERDLSRYDAIVVVLGANELLNLTRIRKWRAGLANLLSVLAEHAAQGTEILVTGIPRSKSPSVDDSLLSFLVDRHAGLLNRETARLCAETRGATFIELPPRPTSTRGDDRYPTVAQYARWAGAIAESLIPVLTDQDRPDGDRRRARGVADSTEKARQLAVDELDLEAGGMDMQLQRIVSMAQLAFHVESAVFTVLDNDRQWNFAKSGTDLIEVPRSTSFCDFAIQGDEVLLVRDAREDERFKDNPLVVGEPFIRFYAGFPIESPSGQRIGALCVFDASPRRRADDFDVDFLRELALAAQRELGRFMPGMSNV